VGVPAKRRQAVVDRKTKETQVRVGLDLDGQGEAKVSTGVGMLDHLLSQIGKHGLIDITVKASGDLETDEHHTVEDVGLALGRALDEALGKREGIVRMADATVPLDEALATVAVDLSGRGYSVVDVAWTGQRIGELPADLIAHLLWSFASEAKLTLNARVLSGVNDHHKAEALFKALGRALGAASQPEQRLAGKSPSTKGTLKA
jgi:imidazoleglycerol-phosphate dehydratase